MLNSTHLKPLSGNTAKIPVISISQSHTSLLSRCSYPQIKGKLAKFIQIDNFDERIQNLGDCKWISKDELIECLNSKYYKIGFWSSIRTKSLGTFIVVTTTDSKMHFLSMRRNLSGCNFQYDFIKNNIYTKDCNCCGLFNLEKEIKTIHHDFPEKIMILTPIEPYDIPIFLSKM